MVVLERLKEAFAVGSQVRNGPLDTRSQIRFIEAAFDDEIIGLVPPIDHVRCFFLFAHHVAVLNRKIVFEPVFELYINTHI